MAMELPKLRQPDRYIGLYVVDFGEHCSVGFTAEEVAELLESERYKDSKVYKIHKAYPDGTVELKGILPELFQLEAGMLFYSTELETATDDFRKLVGLAVKVAPPCRARVHLARYNENKFAVALIYPAEYDDQLSRWLLDGKYKTAGSAEGGIEAIGRYYSTEVEILEKHQLFSRPEFESRHGQELLAGVKLAVQR